MKECIAEPSEVTTTYTSSVDMYTDYWTYGITGSNDKSRPLINPTFLFSLVGRRFNLHYDTDLCSSFHLALALVKVAQKKLPFSIPEKSEREMWIACRAQFSDWCSAAHRRFQVAPQPTEQSLVVRFAITDALNFCQGLRSYQSGVLETTVYKAPWGGSKLHFHDHSTPKFFNVIDTSNLSDHIGLLNILIVTPPLMHYSPCSVLHTNSLPHCWIYDSQKYFGITRIT